MGIILSRFRKKKSTIEALEMLDKDIKEIEQSGVNAQRKYKKITKLLLIYSVGLYVLCGIIFYFQFTSTIQGKLLYLVPLAISPLLLYIIRMIISWYFNRLFNKNQIRLNEMKKEKKKILDEVMDKETYKVAKEILEKFSTEHLPKPNYNLQLAHASKTDIGLRKRAVTPISSAPKPHQPPNNGMWSGIQSLRPIMPNAVPNRPLPAPATPALQMPAPILPLHRSYIDRVVEYLIGDGPNNRYALICLQCHSHNGMALKEEFEYIGFICCYCRFFNPARKIKPEAPKLDFKSNQESESDSEKTSGENSDEEHKHTTEEKLLNITEDFQSSFGDDPRADESNITEINEEITNITNTASNTGAQEENIEKLEVQNPPKEHINSNQPDSDANCDESLVRS